MTRRLRIALLVSLFWMIAAALVVLSMATELVLTARVGHPWFTLPGPPGRPLLHNVMLFAWIFAPALFSRPESATT